MPGVLPFTHTSRRSPFIVVHKATSSSVVLVWHVFLFCRLQAKLEVLSCTPPWSKIGNLFLKHGPVLSISHQNQRHPCTLYNILSVCTCHVSFPYERISLLSHTSFSHLSLLLLSKQVHYTWRSWFQPMCCTCCPAACLSQNVRQ